MLTFLRILAVSTVLLVSSMSHGSERDHSVAGTYVRADEGGEYFAQFEHDGSGFTFSRSPSGQGLLIIVFQWSTDGDWLLQSDMQVAVDQTRFRAARDQKTRYRLHNGDLETFLSPSQTWSRWTRVSDDEFADRLGIPKRGEQQ